MFKESEFVKIQVGVPLEAANAVREAMGTAGAGTQGNYFHCSFSSRGIGRFIPGMGAKPAIGAINKPEEVEEEMIETICHKDFVKKVILAVKKVHPYEEPAIDIIPRMDIM
jgi:hypothetical protein